jgi:hypothetical protein
MSIDETHDAAPRSDAERTLDAVLGRLRGMKRKVSSDAACSTASRGAALLRARGVLRADPLHSSLLLAMPRSAPSPRRPHARRTCTSCTRSSRRRALPLRTGAVCAWTACCATTSCAAASTRAPRRWHAAVALR